MHIVNTESAGQIGTEVYTIEIGEDLAGNIFRKARTLAVDVAQIIVVILYDLILKDHIDQIRREDPTDGLGERKHIVTVKGVRKDIAQGDITYGQVYESFPFDNEVVIIKITGDILKSKFLKY